MKLQPSTYYHTVLKAMQQLDEKLKANKVWINSTPYTLKKNRRKMKTKRSESSI